MKGFRTEMRSRATDHYLAGLSRGFKKEKVICIINPIPSKKENENRRNQNLKSKSV
jgi:hypothetical protein